jgi:hypothetical protein
MFGVRNYKVISIFFASIMTSTVFSMSGVGDSKVKHSAIKLPEGAEIIYSADVIRHGARTPIVKIPGIKYPSLWNEMNIPKGQLTMNGFLQIRILGNRSHQQLETVLPEKYSQDSFCVRTTGVNRTIMSALAYLSGLFPDQLYGSPQHPNLNFYSEAHDDDNLLLQTNTKPDNSYKKANGWKLFWENEAYDNYKKWYDINTNFFTVVDSQYQEKCLKEKNIPSEKAYACLMDIIRLADNVMTLDNYCSDSNHDCNAGAILNLSQNDIDKINEYFGWVYTRDVIAYPYHKDYEFTKYLEAYQQNGFNTGSNLISEIIHNVEVVEQSSGKLPNKFTLYSGHDTTTFNILSYLINNNLKAYQGSNIPMEKYPYFGATVRFIFYKQNQQLKALVIYYNSYAEKEGNIVIGQKVKGGQVAGVDFAEFKKMYYSQTSLESIHNKSHCDYLKN